MSNTSTKIFFQKKVHNILNWAAIYVLYTQKKQNSSIVILAHIMLVAFFVAMTC